MDGHDHAHGDGHGHGHAPKTFGRAFAIGAALNGGFVAVQIVFGLAAHSVALLADALHNAGDVLGLLLAWGASVAARQAPWRGFTYGFGRSTILASLTNAVVLLLGAGAIAVAAVQRFGAPAPVAGGTVMAVAALGIVINGATALMFMRGQEDLNVRGAFLHMAADAGVSAGVLLSGLAIRYTGATWLDPVASLGIVAVIVGGTWGLLRASVFLAMDAAPAGIDVARLRDALGALPGVAEVHDLHVWALSTTQSALTAHLVHGTDAEPGVMVHAACMMVRERFGIAHATIQAETLEVGAACALRPAEVV